MTNTKMKLNLFKNTSLRITAKIILDVCAFSAAWIVSFMIRFPTDPWVELEATAAFIPLVIIIELACFMVFRQYAAMWRYSDLYMIEGKVKAITLASVTIASVAFFLNNIEIPRSILIINWLLVIFFSSSIRLMVRKIFEFTSTPSKNGNNERRVIIYGAGQAGDLLLRNIENTRQVGFNVIGLIDDDPVKQGQYIHKKRVLGNRTMIGELVRKHKVKEIIFSIPSLSGLEIRKLLRTIQDQVGDDVEIKTMPGLTDLADDRVTINELRRFEIKDLLKRKPVHLDFTPVKELIAGKAVMVVGGGGSIGTELCKQIASFNPGSLIILDNNEYNLYNAEIMIRDQFPTVDSHCIVADACKRDLMTKVFKSYKPAIIFHAAAYKHVPLMEMNPWIALDNNLTSTLVLVELCREFKVERFILISTDKAVQPTSVMGATKRVCEQISLVNKNENSTKFMVVRFGNVLGSSGSVIPKFRSQIEASGPVTVTHREVTRYFMLVSEAVELVLQAGATGTSGNIYVLDMGQPINITELAKYMIELSGLRPNKDIQIIYSGLRPGEKLHESLYLEGEERSTDVPNLLQLTPKDSPDGQYINNVSYLLKKLYDLNHVELLSELGKLVPEYTPCDIGRQLDQM